MPDVINEYQKWKQQGEDLRVQAKHAMEIRFRDLLPRRCASPKSTARISAPR